MMKIPDSYTTVMAGSDTIRKELRKKETEKSKSTAKAAADAVNISNRGQEVAHARNLALAAPEVRQGLIDEIVGLIRHGKYDVDGEQVAPKMIRDHTMDWMVESR